MPFGNLNFTCPAKRVYGPKMIAVLIAALAKHVTAEKWTFECNVHDPRLGTSRGAMRL